MDQNRLQYLHGKYVNNQMSPDELLEWKAAVTNPGLDQSILELMDSQWLFLTGQEKKDLNVGKFEDIYQNITAHRQPKKAIRRLWPRIAIAAAAVTVIFGAGLLYFKVNMSISTDQVAYQNDIDPGTQGATLMLASGKKIRLSDAVNGELAKEAGVVITKSADGKLVYEAKGAISGDHQINTLSTRNGETYQVRLPDGSLVHLNAASSITYSPALMEHGKRIVHLQGEAFFEVAKVIRLGTSSSSKPFKKRVPFIVETGSQSVEVLGTHFDVMAYGDEPNVSTTLVEGSVRVSALDGGSTVTSEAILKPGEQAVNNGQEIRISPANLENITDWKDGDFYLNHVNFKTAMRKIARWYNVKVIYDRSVPDDIQSGGWISRSRKLSDVLKHIASSGQVHFKVEGRKVYVSR